jgi:hypothetical protein
MAQKLGRVRQTLGLLYSSVCNRKPTFNKSRNLNSIVENFSQKLEPGRGGGGGGGGGLYSSLQQSPEFSSSNTSANLFFNRIFFSSSSARSFLPSCGRRTSSKSGLRLQFSSSSRDLTTISSPSCCSCCSRLLAIQQLWRTKLNPLQVYRKGGLRSQQSGAGGSRSYHVDQRGVEHFRRRGPTAWLQGPDSGQTQKRLIIAVVIFATGSVYVYFTHLQTVPYTHRKHFVLISPDMEKSLGEAEFDNIKKQFRTKILPPIHPETIRVRRIAKEVIEAAMAGAKAQNWGQLEHTHVPPSISDSGGSSSSSSWGEDLTTAKKDNLDSFPAHKQMYGTETLDDDHWVEKSRKKGLEEGSEGYTAHLESLKWEVLVVDQDIMNAFCLPGGKIVVFTGLLKHFRSDSEIATVLAHEVGHVVARHVAEKLTQGVWLGFLQLLVLSFFYMPNLVNNTSNLLLTLPFSRR